MAPATHPPPPCFWKCFGRDDVIVSFVSPVSSVGSVQGVGSVERNKCPRSERRVLRPTRSALGMLFPTPQLPQTALPRLPTPTAEPRFSGLLHAFLAVATALPHSPSQCSPHPCARSGAGGGEGSWGSVCSLQSARPHPRPSRSLTPPPTPRARATPSPAGSAHGERPAQGATAYHSH